MILLDSNIWIYALDQTTPEHEAARRALFAIDDSGGEILLPAVVQMEVVDYLRKVLGPDADASIRAVLEFPAHSRPLDQHAIRGGDRHVISSRYGIGLRDGTILYHARQDRAVLWTHDGALLQAARHEGIEADDPTLPGIEPQIPRPRTAPKRTRARHGY